MKLSDTLNGVSFKIIKTCWDKQQEIIRETGKLSMTNLREIWLPIQKEYNLSNSEIYDVRLYFYNNPDVKFL